jgi:hypothetical protein
MNTYQQLTQVFNVPGGGGAINGPLPGNPTSIGDLFKLNGNNLLSVVVFLAGAALLGYLVIGGYKYLTAQGDPKAMDSARNTITYALIGFAIVAFSYIIFQVVETFFGIKILGEIPTAYAQGVDIGNTKLGNGTIKGTFGNFGALISRGLLFAQIIAGVIFMVMLVLAGLKWVGSQGDKAALQSARGTITTAAIGLVIVVCSYLVLQAIQFITGFNVTSG